MVIHTLISIYLSFHENFPNAPSPRALCGRIPQSSDYLFPMLINKIEGCLYGYAIGDALGLGTEFMTRDEVKVRYPDGLRHYEQIIHDAHRTGWKKGEFSTDTKLLLEMAESIIERRDIDYMHVAAKLKHWFETDDNHDIDSAMRWIFRHPDYTKNPHAVCEEIYNRQGHFEAHNEALGRCMLAGLWPGDIERHVIDNCRLTHWDTRCIVSGIMLAMMANSLYWDGTEADYDELCDVCSRLDPQVLPYLKLARKADSLDVFNLDDEDTLWYTRKAMAVALWTIWHRTDPAEALYEIIGYGGDADTNAAIAMSLMGLKYGVKSFPKHLVEGLLDHRRILNASDRLAEVVIEAGKAAGRVQRQ